MKTSTKTIFVCDDDEGILDVIKIVLEDIKYHVVAIRNGDKIFNALTKATPSLILLDLWMPGLGGEEIAKRLKNDPNTSGIPIVIISARKDAEEVVKKIKADDLLKKPFDIMDLEKVASKYCCSD